MEAGRLVRSLLQYFSQDDRTFSQDDKIIECDTVRGVHILNMSKRWNC